MERGQSCAVVLAQSELRPLPSPHGTSSAPRWNGLTVCSTVLPWPTAPRQTLVQRAATREGQRRPDRNRIRTPSNLGGDWKHPLQGPDRWHYRGPAQTLVTLESLGLQVATMDLPHRVRGLCSIDHIAIPVEWTVEDRTRLRSGVLSDHDAYVIEATCRLVSPRAASTDECCPPNSTQDD